MLHEILEFARLEELDSVPGYKPKNVRWLLQFSPEGEWIGPAIDLADETNKKSKGKEFPRCPDLTFSELIGLKTRHFLVDSLDKVVLLTKNEPTLKERSDQASFISLLEKASQAIPELGPISKALRDESVLTLIRENLREKKAKPNDSATLAVMQDHLPLIFVESDRWHPWWNEFRTAIAMEKAGNSPAEKSNLMRCFLSGEMVEPAPTQNKISGLSDVGGFAMGDVISSFDKEAFGHFEFKQGQNAAMSEEMVKAVTDALNLLIRRSIRLQKVRIAYWYNRKIPPQEDLFQDLFGLGIDADPSLAAVRIEDPQDVPPNEPQDDPVDPSPARISDRDILQAESTAKKLLESIRSGQRAELRDCRFFAVTLSGNSGRVIIRDWMQGGFEQLAESIDAWFRDLSIVSRDGREIIKRQKFNAILASTVRDLKDVPTPTETALWRCAVNKNRPIPDSLMAQVLHRVRLDIVKDQSPRTAGLGLLRAFCIRNPGVPEMTAELDKTIDDPAYLSGRIMALLASIQEAALGDVGAGVVQRYYAAASATPALVLGRLVRTAQIAHLPKLEGGLRHYFESQLTEIWMKMKAVPPTTLNLEKQTLFAMGYYQQQAARNQKKSGKSQQESPQD